MSGSVASSSVRFIHKFYFDLGILCSGEYFEVSGDLAYDASAS